MQFQKEDKHLSYKDFIKLRENGDIYIRSHSEHRSYKVKRFRQV